LLASLRSHISRQADPTIRGSGGIAFFTSMKFDHISCSVMSAPPM
jgi:hypothetical protein